LYGLFEKLILLILQYSNPKKCDANQKWIKAGESISIGCRLSLVTSRVSSQFLEQQGDLTGEKMIKFYSSFS